MARKNPLEIATIVNLRKKHPTMGKLTLAKKIVRIEFDDKADNDLALKIGTGRTILSTYSVIRRYDKQQAAFAKAANASTPAAGLALA